MYYILRNDLDTRYLRHLGTYYSTFVLGEIAIRIQLASESFVNRDMVADHVF